MGKTYTCVKCKHLWSKE